MGLVRGGKRSSRSGWFSPGHPHTCRSILPLCFAWQRLWVSLQNPNSRYFYKQTAPASQGMLEALAPSSKQGGRSWHDAPRLRLPPGEEHHLLLPDGFHPSPLGIPVFFKSLFASGVCRSAAFPCQHACWQRPRFPLSKQRPFFHIPTWISSQLLREHGRDPLKATLELPLPPCFGP